MHHNLFLNRDKRLYGKFHDSSDDITNLSILKKKQEQLPNKIWVALDRFLLEYLLVFSDTYEYNAKLFNFSSHAVSVYPFIKV